MEYKRRSDTWPDYKQRGEKAVNKQYEKVRKEREEKGADTGWTIKQVNLVMGTKSIELGSWNAYMAVFGIDKAQLDKMRGKHMKRLLAEHDFVLQSYWVQHLKVDKAIRKGSKEIDSWMMMSSSALKSEAARKREAKGKPEDCNILSASR